LAPPGKKGQEVGGRGSAFGNSRRERVGMGDEEILGGGLWPRREFAIGF